MLCRVDRIQSTIYVCRVDRIQSTIYVYVALIGYKVQYMFMSR